MKAHGIDWIQNKTWVEYERPSFPLYSIITAAGFTRIDFLSLDVQGAEIGILKNYPFEKIPVKVSYYIHQTKYYKKQFFNELYLILSLIR